MQRLADELFHDIERAPVRQRTKVRNLNDVGMIEPRNGLRFDHKPLHQLAIVSEFV